MTQDERGYTAFGGTQQIDRGPIEKVVLAAKAYLDQGHGGRIAIFADATGGCLDVDLRGSADEVVARLADHPMLPRRDETTAGSKAPKGRGRPKLGVVSREVTLLPRHWDWLAQQKGGASVILRKLVEQAGKKTLGQERARLAKEATHRFMWDMASHCLDFEEATRAFYADNDHRFYQLMEDWPADIREHVKRLNEMARALEQEAAGS